MSWGIAEGPFLYSPGVPGWSERRRKWAAWSSTSSPAWGAVQVSHGHNPGTGAQVADLGRFEGARKSSMRKEASYAFNG